MICIHLAEGFEEIEATTVADVLIRGGLDVKLVSISHDRSVIGAHGIKMISDNLITEIDYDKCDAIVLPGGMPGTLNLMENKYLLEMINKLNDKNKLVAAICAAPMVLDKAGILVNKKATIYDGMESHINSAIYTKDSVVKDKNIITSRGPGTAMSFSLEILKELNGSDVYKEVKESLLY